MDSKMNSLKTTQSPLRPIDLRIVLVRSIYERNVGATARAMSNMGFQNLILINPQCEFTQEAHMAAANGQDPLRNRTVYTNWEEFYTHEPRGIQIATTARDGKGRQVEDLGETLNQFKNNNSSLNKTSEEPFVFHLIFGPEDWGLSADDIQYAHNCCCIPTYGENSSLNLAQATLLAMHIFRTVFSGQRTLLEGHQKPKKLQKKPLIFPDQTLKEWLQVMNIDLSKRKTNIYNVLRRMLLQNAPSEKEFRMLEIVLQQSIRKMKKNSD